MFLFRVVHIQACSYRSIKLTSFISLKYFLNCFLVAHLTKIFEGQLIYKLASVIINVKTKIIS